MQRSDFSTSVYQHQVGQIKAPDIYHYPDTIESIESECYLIHGDMHGNFINFLYFLVRKGLVSITAEDYQTLANIYQKIPPEMNDSRESSVEINPVCSGDIEESSAETAETAQSILSKEDVQNFDNTLKKITLTESPASLILAGDELSDRGNNDIFTLFLIRRLHQIGMRLRIILSNHSVEFLNAYRHGIPSSWLDPNSAYYQTHRSQRLLDQSIKADLLEQKKLDQLIHEDYLPHLKALSYSIDPHDSKITICTHAPVGLDTLKKIAEEYYTIDYDDSNLLALCRTLDEINESFAVNIDRTVQSIAKSKKISTPLVDLVWARYEKYVNDFLRNNNHYYLSYKDKYPLLENETSTAHYKQYKHDMMTIFQLDEKEESIVERYEKNQELIGMKKEISLKVFNGIHQAYINFKKFMDEKLSCQTTDNSQPDYKTDFPHGHCGLELPIHPSMTNLDISLVGREDLTAEQIESFEDNYEGAFDLPFLQSSQILGPVEHIIETLTKHPSDQLFSLLRQDMHNMVNRLKPQTDSFKLLQKLLLQWLECSDEHLPQIYNWVRIILDGFYQANHSEFCSVSIDNKDEMLPEPREILIVLNRYQSWQLAQLTKLKNQHSSSFSAAKIIPSLIKIITEQEKVIDHFLFESLIRYIKQ
nr:hypothetical protein [Legionellales bacterium]